MPFGDRTGPTGAGPRTGRALGFCNGYDAPGAYRGGGRIGGRMRGGWRADFGFGGGRGGGWRNRFWQQPMDMPMDANVNDLAGRITMLEDELRMAREQLERLQPADQQKPETES